MRELAGLTLSAPVLPQESAPSRTDRGDAPGAFRPLLDQLTSMMRRASATGELPLAVDFTGAGEQASEDAQAPPDVTAAGATLAAPMLPAAAAAGDFADRPAPGDRASRPAVRSVPAGNPAAQIPRSFLTAIGQGVFVRNPLGAGTWNREVLTGETVGMSVPGAVKEADEGRLPDAVSTASAAREAGRDALAEAVVRLGEQPGGKAGAAGRGGARPRDAMHRPIQLAGEPRAAGERSACGDLAPAGPGTATGAQQPVSTPFQVERGVPLHPALTDARRTPTPAGEPERRPSFPLTGQEQHLEAGERRLDPIPFVPSGTARQARETPAPGERVVLDAPAYPRLEGEGAPHAASPIEPLLLDETPSALSEAGAAVPGENRGQSGREAVRPERELAPARAEPAPKETVSAGEPAPASAPAVTAGPARGAWPAQETPAISAEAGGDMSEALRTAQALRSEIFQMVRSISGELLERGSALHLRLQPERLGDLELRVATEEGVVSARFIAQTEQVRALIEAALPELRQQLEESGIGIDQLDVLLGSEPGQEGSAFDGQGKGSAGGLDRWEAPHRPASSPPQQRDEGTDGGGVSAGGRVDLWV